MCGSVQFALFYPLRLTALLSLLPSLLSRPISSSQTLGHSRLPPAQGPCGCSSCQKGPPKYPQASLRSTQLTPTPLLKRPSLKMLYDPLLHFQFYVPTFPALLYLTRPGSNIHIPCCLLSLPAYKAGSSTRAGISVASPAASEAFSPRSLSFFVKSTLASHLGDLV